MVVGDPIDAGVGLVVAVAVAVLLVVAVIVAEAVTGACSSRKTMNALLHQCSFVNAT